MLKIIHRAVFRELLFTFFIALAFLNSILIMEKLLRLSRLLSGVGATGADMAVIVLYLQPQLLLLTIPMALMLSTLLVYGRMNADNEITIMRACGMDFRKIAFPVALLGLFSFCATLAVGVYLGPKSSMKLREAVGRTISSGSANAVEEGVFNTLFKDVVIFVKGKKGADTLRDIFIYDGRDKDSPKVLMAREGKIFVRGLTEIGLFLTNGYVNISVGRNITELFFDRYMMILDLEAGLPAPKRTELTPAELIRKIGKDGTPRKKAFSYIELHRRFSLPAVCLILVVLGPPLALMSGKSGRLGGLAIGLLVFTGYYMLLIYGENSVLAGKVPHYVGSWAPAAVLLGVAVVFSARRGEM